MQLKICDDHPVYSNLSEIYVIKSLEELADYKEEWNKILIDNNNTNPFLEYEWIDSWWNFFGKGYSLFIFALKMEDKIVGFCPFMIIKRRFFKEITFIGHPEASYMECILAREGGAHGVKSALDYIKNLKGNYILHLHGLCEESDTYKIFENYFKQNQYKFFIRSFVDLYLRINEDFTSYLKKRSKHNAIKTLLKNKNKLEGLGDLTSKELKNSELDGIFHLHEKRWERKYDTSNFSKKKHKEFFRTIANNTKSSLQVRIYGLMLGKRLIAFIYGFQCNGTYYIYRIAHDNDFAVFCPGKIILLKLLEACFQNDIQILDFGLGYAMYKLEWTNNKKIVYEFVAPLASGFSRIFYYKYLIRKIVINNLKKLKSYDMLKVRLMGIVHCFFTGVYYREIISALMKKKVNSKVCNILKKVMKNLYSKKEYMIYEKSCVYSSDEAIMKYKSCKSTDQQENESLNTLSDSKADIIINEVNLNDLEFICQLTKEKPAQIIKRFYKKQRCFLMNDGGIRKDCLWVNYNNIEIPEINYQDKLSKNRVFINLTNADVREDSMKNYLQAINCIMNMLYLERYTICYVCFNPKKESLKNLMAGIGFQTVYLIKYKRILFKSYVKIKK